ncbi:MAG TPA: CooT family nickel-binding protein [Candidatus Korarchaeota archaeon]|nr:CooT family nickel-binding protein [Candidatus Korarchaeota archaeon]
MCEGVALVISEGSEKTVMEEVVSVSVRGDRITLLNEDGDSLEFLGVKEVLIDLVRHRVTIILG